MKICVYAICKNEEAFVDRFMTNLDEADCIVVADTGSSDHTVEKLRGHGVTVAEIVVDPWRFDTARNVSMQLLPADVDVCVCIDLDEVLSKGWRAEIERTWVLGHTDRLRYMYWWSVNPDDTPGTSFWYDKIHARRGFRWVKPVHEVLEFYGDHPERQVYAPGITLKHFPDSTKSRGSYLGLLEVAAREQPNDDRSSHYLGREYMYYGKYQESIAELQRHLKLPSSTWDAERAASMRFIGNCHRALGDLVNAERWYLRSCAEAPGEREPWVKLADLYREQGKFPACYAAADRALAIKDRPASYICEPEAWGAVPHDLASLGAYWSGLKEVSLGHARDAVALDPKDERLQNNVKLIEEGIRSTS